MVRKQDNRNPNKILTPTELELMSIIWRLGGCTVHELLEQLPDERILAYTSASTIVRILEQKGFVSSEKVGRGYRYLPAVTKEDYEKTTLRNVIDTVFEGTPSDLIRCLVSSEELNEDEYQSIRKLIEERRTK